VVASDGTVTVCFKFINMAEYPVVKLEVIVHCNEFTTRHLNATKERRENLIFIMH